SGMQYLCDNGAEIMAGSDKFFGERGPVKAMSGIGTFSEYAVVHENSVVPVGDWYPLEAVSLCSCGVATGWGSAVNVADVSAGDTVVVVGTGGIGVNAVQGAAMAGAANVIAVDPIEMKREFAQTMGATHAVASIEEATPLVQELSWGRGANQVIITVGDATSDLFAPAMGMVGKGGSLTLTSLSNMMQNDISLNTVDFAMSGKHLHGSIYGYCNPRADIPKLLRLYDQGKLKLDELVTQKYALEDINEGYRALHDGEIIRGLIDFSL
ncbi:MAG: zinc-binding dehydrogenase, partial [Acidimicrobiaceae bacterium]